MEPQGDRPRREAAPQPERLQPRAERPAPETERIAPDAQRTRAESQPVPKASDSKSFLSGNGLVKLLIVVILALTGWFFFGRSTGVYTGPEEAAPNYDKNKNANPAIPAGLTAADVDHARTDAAKAAALRGESIPGVVDPSPALIEAVKKGDVTFYAIRAYDTCAEDGDVVTIQLPIGGQIGPIPLTIAGTTVSIPVVAGQPAQVNILAVKDGVGGVTLGAQSSTGVWFSKVLPVGGSETMLLNVN